MVQRPISILQILNYYLSAIYSNRFFDVREYLVNAANTNLPQDLWTFTNDIRLTLYAAVPAMYT